MGAFGDVYELVKLSRVHDKVSAARNLWPHALGRLSSWQGKILSPYLSAGYLHRTYSKRPQFLGMVYMCSFTCGQLFFCGHATRCEIHGGNVIVLQCWVWRWYYIYVRCRYLSKVFIGRFWNFLLIQKLCTAAESIWMMVNEMKLMGQDSIFVVGKFKTSCYNSEW